MSNINNIKNKVWFRFNQDVVSGIHTVQMKSVPLECF